MKQEELDKLIDDRIDKKIEGFKTKEPKESKKHLASELEECPECKRILNKSIDKRLDKHDLIDIDEEIDEDEEEDALGV